MTRYTVSAAAAVRIAVRLVEDARKDMRSPDYDELLKVLRAEQLDSSLAVANVIAAVARVEIDEGRVALQLIAESCEREARRSREYLQGIVRGLEALENARDHLYPPEKKS